MHFSGAGSELFTYFFFGGIVGGFIFSRLLHVFLQKRGLKPLRTVLLANSVFLALAIIFIVWGALHDPEQVGFYKIVAGVITFCTGICVLALESISILAKKK